jgi:uncharacterized membrane protein
MSEPNVPPPPPTAGGSNDKTLMLVLSYLGLLCLIPLLTEKDDANIQWHAKHGLVQFFFFVIVYAVLGVVTSTGIGCVFAVLYPIVFVAWLVVMVLSIVKATKGERLILPGITQFVEKF